MKTTFAFLLLLLLATPVSLQAQGVNPGSEDRLKLIALLLAALAVWHAADRSFDSPDIVVYGATPAGIAAPSDYDLEDYVAIISLLNADEFDATLLTNSAPSKIKNQVSALVSCHLTS